MSRTHGAKRWRGHLAWFVLVVMLAGLFPIAPAVAQGPAAGSVSAVSIAAYTGVAADATLVGDPSALRVGSTFAVWVTVNATRNLQGVELQLRFSPEVLQVRYLRDQLGRDVPVLVPGPINQVAADRGTVDNRTGKVSYGAANMAAANYPDGTALLKIGFTVVGEGEAFVRFAAGSPELADGAAGIINLVGTPVTPLAFRVGAKVVPVPVTGVTLTPTAATIYVGATRQFNATVAPVNATNRAITWSSNTPSVATVTTGGLVTGRSTGQAVITVRTIDGGRTAASVITVVAPAATGPAPTPAPTPPASAPVVPAPVPAVVERSIIAGQTTEVELEGVVKVTVAPGSIIGEAPLVSAQVMPTADAQPLLATATAVGLAAASEVVALNLTGGEFRAPAQLTLHFDAARVAAGQVPSVFAYNERTRRWIYLGGQAGVGTITVTVNRFSRFAVFATKPQPAMADIADHWSRGSSRTLAGMGIVAGYPDGNFKPNANITRAEFVAMLARALGLEAKPEAAARFKDAAGFGWARGIIGAAVEAGLIAGFPNGTFGASRQITRAEIAAILQRIINKGLVPVTLAAGVTFTDVAAIPDWAVDGVWAANRAGLVRGFPDGAFRPGSNATRAEMTAMLYRLIAER